MLSSYSSYLKFKHTIDVIREKESSRQDVADALGVPVESTWHIMRVLVKHGVIKIVRYEIHKASKRGIYKLMKDE